MAGWRSVRVFLSSTFRDMHAERDHLIKVTFPALRERLLPHRVELYDIVRKPLASRRSMASGHSPSKLSRL